MMPSSNSRKDLTDSFIELTAELKNLPNFISFALDRARQLGFSQTRIDEIELVLEEALVNVMDYAYPDQKGFLKLLLKPEAKGGLCLSITDQGCAFNPLAQQDPDLEPELMERPVGGLGIFLMKELSDKIFWQRLNNENCLTIIFKQRHA